MNLESTKKNQMSTPLVSIIVITYNSSQYVIETLESAKAQTYKNIELIISDDCSNDNTVKICKEWIEENNYRFFRTELIVAEKNTGIPANCNRGLGKAKGEWIKFIAGDDILIHDCITNLINFSNGHPIASLIHGRVVYINSIGEVIRVVKSKEKLVYPTFAEEFQRNHIHSPTIFVLKKVFDEIGGFDENYAIEDIYLFLKILDKGLVILYTDNLLVKYRIHSNNTSAKNDMILTNHLLILDAFKNKKGFFVNYLAFCRNTLLHKIPRKTFFNSVKILLNFNPYSILVFFDILFHYKAIKILIKNLIGFSSRRNNAA